MVHILYGGLKGVTTMRESLYRGKPKNSRYGDFVYGNYLSTITKKGERTHYIKREEDGLLNPIEIERESLSEETGLLDCNSELIFENDIVEYRDKVCVIKFDKKIAAFIVCSGTWCAGFNDIDSYDLKVIGNTTYNKELLKNCS